MPLKRVFLERGPSVPEQTIDKLESLLRSKIDLKTGFAEPHALARCMLHTLKCLDTSEDGVFTRQSFPLVMDKLNCGDDRIAVDALFHRYDRQGTGKVTLKEFSDGLFGLTPIARSDAECREIISKVRELLREKGEVGFCEMDRIFRMIDDNKYKKIDKYELNQALTSNGINLTPYELDTLMFYFDKDKDGLISVSEFMVGLRPKMSDARTNLVKLAFLSLDKNPNGQITFNELLSMFIPERHPAVLRNEKSPSQVLEEFTNSWNKRPNDVISEKEFIEFYSNLSTCIDNDNYFELMVRNTLNIRDNSITGKKTPYRLLVTHMNGTKTIETIESDSLNVNNNMDLVNSLRKQGVTDILKVEQALHC